MLGSMVWQLAWGSTLGLLIFRNSHTRLIKEYTLHHIGVPNRI